MNTVATSPTALELMSELAVIDTKHPVNQFETPS